LFFAGNQIVGSIPSEIGLLSPTLNEIELYDMRLTGTIPDELYSLSMLLSLDISGSELTGVISSKVGQLSCQSGWLNDNFLSGTLPTELGLITGLRTFFINGNDISGSIPQELCDLRLDSTKTVLKVKADCATIFTGETPIECPEGCCTECCNAETQICMEM
jgi:hypothetical protein